MKKLLKKLRSKKTKKRIKYLSKHPLVVPVSTFMFLFFMTLVMFVMVGGQTIGATDTRVVQLYIDGQSRVVPTRADTVADLLERLNITVAEKDIIEPSLTAEITDDNFQINVYKARPVLVEDNGIKVVTLTAEPSPRAAVKAAGVEVFPEDIVERQPLPELSPSDIIKEGGIEERIVIDRATPVSLNIYGTVVKVRTHATTVEDLLKEKNIEVKEDDSLEPGPSTLLTNDVSVSLARVGTKLESVEEEIPLPLEYIDDPNMARGIENVKTEGRAGQKVVTYEIILENDIEVGRTAISEVIAIEPVTQVVVRGTKFIVSNPSANVALGQQIAAEMGYSDQFSCIYDIFQRESGWNHLASNRNSGAYGIPQALPGSKMGPGWQSDPAVQIRWGIGYMVNRYGSPCGAYRFWQVNHWY